MRRHGIEMHNRTKIYVSFTQTVVKQKITGKRLDVTICDAFILCLGDLRDPFIRKKKKKKQ